MDSDILVSEEGGRCGYPGCMLYVTTLFTSNEMSCILYDEYNRDPWHVVMSMIYECCSIFEYSIVFALSSTMGAKSIGRMVLRV
jgi:hypothetical protein